jgi:hypothetical protein
VSTRKTRIIFVNILLLCSAGMGACGQSQSSEQQHFSAEASITKEPISIPEIVLAVLAKDQHVRSVLKIKTFNLIAFCVLVPGRDSSLEQSKRS